MFDIVRLIDDEILATYDSYSEAKSHYEDLGLNYNFVIVKSL